VTSRTGCARSHSGDDGGGHPIGMSMRAYRFPDEFFDYMDRGSRRSAARLVPEIAAALEPTSVLDVGCGRGVWLAEWKRAGVRDCVGVDGDYVDQANLAIPSECFIAGDLSQPLDLNRNFDIVQSLEVAQCIGIADADVFVETLCRHGELIIFSAAVPGQGGERHINEQPIEYWRRKFSLLGYIAFDWIRPLASSISEVEPWYRYNSLLFASERAAGDLPLDIRATRVTSAPIANVAPLSWRLRNAALRCLPQRCVHQLALVKHQLVNWVGR
jgi:SAM-dependent methyltransferase